MSVFTIAQSIHRKGLYMFATILENPSATQITLLLIIIERAISKGAKQSLRAR
jgi:hypothetical protein